MGQGASLFAGVIVLAAVACDTGGNQLQEPAGADADASRSDDRIRHLGPVTYSYDPVVLTAANVRIAVPPGTRLSVVAEKLVPVRSAAGSGALCPKGRTACPIEDQPGLTLALLERPYASYIEALRTSDMAGRLLPAAIDGHEGIALDLGASDGIATQYRIVPLGERALLIKLQFGEENRAEDGALEEAAESIDIAD